MVNLELIRLFITLFAPFLVGALFMYVLMVNKRKTKYEDFHDIFASMDNSFRNIRFGEDILYSMERDLDRVYTMYPNEIVKFYFGCIVRNGINRLNKGRIDNGDQNLKRMWA